MSVLVDWMLKPRDGWHGLASRRVLQQCRRPGAVLDWMEGRVYFGGIGYVIEPTRSMYERAGMLFQEAT